ncbi:SusD/RagB family nutrient-binding outer membrane lipoprotein [Aurantibacter crassamenti]|uniref:SusD/RagB family nutrient-binding outer membrane lipoprotein n=1 Tax=Aurantibacter crassamenti TaxID=1837375 RepID=UPI0019396F97|nr:SusD/RagB family nutrient-binding outer membrane lipoprotein [Aurantibacter crassamenti]MBM1106107.1 SusD/RagB family nutrient-binding outer membrane lipoprotein [Aurantibacter crassamenti]
MKNIKNIFLILLLTLSFSCSDSLEEVNIDPNTFPSAGDAQVLSSAIAFMGYIVEQDLNYSESFVWSQYYTWGIGVSIGNEERFVSASGDFNGYWQRAYANSLTDLNSITKNSSSAAYRGIANVLKAHLFQGLVDHFGDIPFTEAISGAIEDGSNLTPNSDSAESTIYPGLVTMLDEALADLALAESGTVGEDDFIYQGDIAKWTKFANSLKLRILMRTSEVNPQGAAIQALINSGTFIETVNDMPFIPFSGVSGDQNPMFARAEFGVGMFYFASNASLNLLQSLNDPRADVLYTKATTGVSEGALRGIDQGTIDDEPFTAPASDYSMASEYAYGETKPAILMSPWEVWFLRAEADARYNTSDNAEAAFSTAIELNFNYMEVADPATYISTLDFASAATLDAQLDLIGIQKWISLNGTQEDEGWIESRRFDRPSSRLFTDGIFQTPPLSVLPSGTFPSAWLYPESERSLNPNASPQRSITDAIFWDN